MRNREGTDSTERQSQSKDNGFDRRHASFKPGGDTEAQSDARTRSEQVKQETESRQYTTIEGKSVQLTEGEAKAVKSAEAAEHDINTYPPEKTAAAVEGGPCALSGWDHGKEGFVQATEEVRMRSQQIGHELKPHKLFDDGVPGRFNACHAEKQMSVVAPDKPIAVSSPMCSDCQSYFRATARYTDKSQVVADPDKTRIFYPDGRVVELPRRAET